jgi:hypothetical protein
MRHWGKVTARIGLLTCIVNATIRCDGLGRCLGIELPNTAVVVAKVSVVPLGAGDIRRRKSLPDIPLTLGKSRMLFSGNGSVIVGTRAIASVAPARKVAMMA